MKRSIALGVLAASLLLLPATPAAAGGNWLDFRRSEGVAGGRSSGGTPARDARSGWDIFVTGEEVLARVSYLSRTFHDGEGPFHLWIERGERLEAGEPIPTTALRVGTFDMRPDGRTGFASFVLPELPRGTYTLSVCDVPCTTYGFEEFVQGWLTSVPSVGEAQLLARVRELRWDERELVASLQDDARAAERREEELLLRVTQLEQQLDRARGQLARVATERPAPAPRSDALIDSAGGAWIASAMLAIAAGVLFVRRRRRIGVPDTPAELMPVEPGATRVVRSERVLEDLDV